MKLLTTYFFILCFCSIGFSQNQSKAFEKAVYQSKLAHLNYTLTLDLSSVHRNTQGELKDEFLTFNEKVLSLQLDEASQIMTLKHSVHFTREEVTDILKKYHIKSSAILTHK